MSERIMVAGKKTIVLQCKIVCLDISLASIFSLEYVGLEQCVWMLGWLPLLPLQC
jgi:hypothetical protein